MTAVGADGSNMSKTVSILNVSIEKMFQGVLCGVPSNERYKSAVNKFLLDQEVSIDYPTLKFNSEETVVHHADGCHTFGHIAYAKIAIYDEDECYDCALLFNINLNTENLNDTITQLALNEVDLSKCSNWNIGDW